MIIRVVQHKTEGTMIIEINKSDVSRFYLQRLGMHMSLIKIGRTSYSVDLCFVISEHHMPAGYNKPFSFREMGEGYEINDFHEDNPYLLFSIGDVKIIFQLFLSSEFSKNKKVYSIVYVLFKDVEVNSDNGLYSYHINNKHLAESLTKGSFFTEDNIYLIGINSYLPPDNIIKSVNRTIEYFNQIISDDDKFNEILNAFKISESAISKAIAEDNLRIRVGC